MLIQSDLKISEHMEVTPVNRSLSEATGGRAEQLGTNVEEAGWHPVTGTTAALVEPPTESEGTSLGSSKRQWCASEFDQKKGFVRVS